MKFFKHFTDAHSGESLMEIRRKLGMAGIGQYWTLLEICAKRMDWDHEGPPNIDDCVFKFDRDHLAFLLGTRPSHICMVLAIYEGQGCLTLSSDGHQIFLSIPKLLECLDRDYKRARSDRAPCAPKTKIKIKKEIKNKNNTLADSQVLGNAMRHPPAGGAVPVAFYCEAYKEKYRHNPEVKGKRAGILHRIFKDHGETAYRRIISGYFGLPDAYLAQRSHPVELIESKLNEIIRFIETGKVVSRGTAKKFDEKVTQEHGIQAPRIEDILAAQDEQKLLKGE